MEVVNRLGGEGKMDAEELSRIFNDAGVSMSKKTFQYFDLRMCVWYFYRPVIIWLFISAL